MKTLWNKEQEINFFKSSRKVATPEQLFYCSDDKRYLAYWPKGYKGEKTTLQSRNAFIGSYTEKWCSELLKDFAIKVKAYTVQDVICEEIGLANKSPADVALCKTNTMLKAIGKSINIRVSSYKAAKIPIVIIGNTPISNSYFEKADHLKKCGIIQGFWSVNPSPLDKEDTLKNTKAFGFYRFDIYNELEQELDRLLIDKREFFSSMQTKNELGRIIEIANKESTYEKKAERFLELIRK